MAKPLFDEPRQQERIYTRLLLQFSTSLARDANAYLVSQLPTLVQEYSKEIRGDSWEDTLNGIMATLKRAADYVASVVIQKLPAQFTALSKFNENQFKLVVKANTGMDLPPKMPGAPANVSLGVNVFRSEPFLQPLANNWIKTNTDLISSLPTRLHPELEGIVRRGVTQGYSVKQLKDEIQKRYGVTDYRATLIAQDQINKGHADLSRHRLQSVGVQEYIWRSVQDNRVRPEHVDYNGNRYAFDKPPPEGNPGQPVRCRCRAEAVWDDVNAAIAELEAPGGVTNKSVIFDQADQAWAALGKPTDIKTVLDMRKKLMVLLEKQFGIPKTTASVTLGDWQKSRVLGAAPPVLPAKVVPPVVVPPVAVPPVTPPVVPPVVPKPAVVKPPVVPKPAAKPAPRPKVDPLASAPDMPVFENRPSTVSTEWSMKAFADSSKRMKDLLRKMGLEVEVRKDPSCGAHYSSTGNYINMSRHYQDAPLGKAVWRHEFGHFMDRMLGPSTGRGSYATHNTHLSSTAPWKTAMRSDKNLMLSSHELGVSRASLNRLESFRSISSTDKRIEFLKAEYKALGIDYDKIDDLMKDHSAVHSAELPISTRERHVRIINAIADKRAESLVEQIQGNDLGGRVRDLAFEKGPLGQLSDLVCSMTRAKLAGMERGVGGGHTLKYYDSDPLDRLTGAEVFANYVSLLADKHASTFSAILENIAPAYTAKFKKEVLKL